MKMLISLYKLPYRDGPETKDNNREAELHEAFRVFDRASSSTISSDKLRYVMSFFGEYLSDEETDARIIERI
jgi:Ca2+-binding EF-hand superfamily protein